MPRSHNLALHRPGNCRCKQAWPARASGFKAAFLLTHSFFCLRKKTWENAVNFPSVVHLGFCFAKSEKLMKIPASAFIFFVDQTDLVNVPRWLIILISVILVLVWLVSIHLQVKWIEYLIKKIKKAKIKVKFL